MAATPTDAHRDAAVRVMAKIGDRREEDIRDGLPTFAWWREERDAIAQALADADERARRDADTIAALTAEVQRLRDPAVLAAAREVLAMKRPASVPHAIR